MNHIVGWYELVKLSRFATISLLEKKYKRIPSWGEGLKE